MGYEYNKINIKQEMFDSFRNGIIVIICNSKKDSLNFLRYCEDQGLKWSSGGLPTKFNYYKRASNNKIMYAHVNSLTCDFMYNYELIAMKYKIVNFEDIIVKEQYYEL